MSFSFFYLIPVALVSWFAGWGAGLVIAFVSVLASLATDVLLQPGHPLTLANYWNASTHLAIFLITTYLVHLGRSRLDDEMKLARTDYLTGAGNLEALRDTATAELYRARRYHHPLTVTYLTVENQIGHRAGNILPNHPGELVLLEVSNSLREQLRSSDFVARLSEDQFVILLPETGLEGGRAINQRIQSQLLKLAEENDWPVSFDLQVRSFHEMPNRVDQLLDWLE